MRQGAERRDGTSVTEPPMVERSPRPRAALLVVAFSFALLGGSLFAQGPLPSGGDPPVIKNSADFPGGQPFDCTIDRDNELVIVNDVDGNLAQVYDLDLQPVGTIPQPSALSVTGVAWNPVDGALYWNVPAAATLFVTDLGGNILASHSFSSPDPGGVLLCLTVNEDTGLLWSGDFVHSTYHEFTPQGVPTGASFASALGPDFGLGTGLAWRVGGEFEICAGTNPQSAPSFVARVDASGAETGTARIDVNPFSFAMGLAFAPIGADGQPSLFVVQSVSGLGQIVEVLASEPSQGQGFVRGDCNQDAVTDISDVIFFLSFVFGIGNEDPVCDDACDVNDDGTLDISDGIFLLGVLFGMGPSIPEPAGSPPGDCGEDPTDDGVECGDYASCP